MKSELMERTAFREMLFTNKVPRQDSPSDRAADNVAAITEELLEHLKKIVERA